MKPTKADTFHNAPEPFAARLRVLKEKGILNDPKLLAAMKRAVAKVVAEQKATKE